ncbi:TonB-dependent receptor [Porticoccus sp. GXU_MW_L64]
MNLKKDRLGMYVALIAAGSAGVVATANAEEQKKSANVLEEIVVEARRVKESLQKVPLSINAFNEDFLVDVGVDDLDSIQTLTPGLTVAGGSDGNSARFYIRGVGTGTPYVGVEPAVPVYIDDVYTPSGLGTALDLFSLDRVEVLKGPQGTLYGRNAFGGAVKVYSKNIAVDEAQGYVSVSTGTESARNIKAEFTAPVVADKLWLSGGYAHLEHDGYQRLTSGAEGWAENADIYKLKALFTPTDQLSITLTYDETNKLAPTKYSKLTQQGTVGTCLDIDPVNGPDFAFSFADLSAFCQPSIGGPELVGAEPIQGNTIADIDTIESDVIADALVELQSFTWTSEYTFSDSASVKYIGSSRDTRQVRAFDIDGTVAPFLAVIQDFRFDSESHEIQLNLDYDNFRVVTGVFSYEESSSVPTLDTPNQFLGQGSELVTNFLGQSSGSNRGGFANQFQELDSFAVYANVNFDLTEKLSLGLGARYTEDEKVATADDGFSFTGGGFAFTGNIIPGAISEPVGVDNVTPLTRFFDVSDEYSETTVEAVLDYQLTEDKLLFASYRQGFQGGQLSTFFAGGVDADGNVTGTSTDSQVLNAYETGFKGTFLDGRAQLNASIYYYDFEDLIVGVNTPVDTLVSATGFASLPTNAGGATSKGIDGDFRFLINDNLTLRGGFAFIDFDIKEVISFDGDGNPQNIADTFIDTFSVTPETEFNLGLDYETDIGDGTLAGYLSVHYRDEIGIDSRAENETSGVSLVPATGIEAIDSNWISPSLATVNAGLSYEVDDWKVWFAGRNLTDQRRPVATIFNVPNVAGTPFVFGVNQQFNEPRTWELGITRSF